MPKSKGGLTKIQTRQVAAYGHKIDLDLVYRLARTQAPMSRIAVICGTSIAKLKEKAEDILAKAYEEGRQELLDLQWEAARKGDKTMLVWLGKQFLGQSDRMVEESISTQIVVNVAMIPS